MHGRGAVLSNGKVLFKPSGLITIISPGSISLTCSAPTISKAQVSDDNTQPSPNFPNTNGRTPLGSLIPISFVRVIATTENAPSTRDNASFRRFI